MARLGTEVALVPQFWHLEVRNALLGAERRGRIRADEVDERLRRLGELPVRTDTEPHVGAAFALARTHGLSMYDAVYLELAQRSDAPFATLDKALGARCGRRRARADRAVTDCAVTSSLCAATALVATLGCAASGQEAPGTSWGHPDLQGIWVGSTLTPLERSSAHEGRQFLTEEEVTALETAALVEEERLLNRPAERAPAGETSTTGLTAASAPTPSGSTRAPLGSRVGARR